MKRFLPYLNANRKTNVFLMIFFLFVVNSAFSATYYSKASGNANSTATWGLNTDGTGTAPGNFTTSGDVFIVRTGSALTMNGNLTIGSGVTLQLIGTITIAAPNNADYVLTVNGTITFSGASANQLIVSTTSGNPNTSNTFTLGSAATLRTVNTNGVAGTNCSISTLTSGKAIVTLPTTANYEFNASAGQNSTGLPTTVNNLILSGSGTKTLPSSLTISANLSISGAVASISAGANYSANSLTLAGSGTNAGTWGSTTSSATYANNTYFAATTGRVTVATYTSTTPSVTPTVGSYTYNGLAQGPNAATNTGTGSSYTFSYVGVSGTTYGPSATLPTNAGNYTVTATVADSSDGFYRSNSSTASAFSIATRALTITANNGTKVYGTTQSTPVTGSTAFGSTGLQNGETIGTVTLNYGSGALAATDPVGSTSTITASAATGGTFTASNYTITYTPNSGTLTVTAATLTITANNGTKVYGNTQSTPVSGSTAFGSTGLQNGETIGTVTLTYGAGALAATDAVGSTSTITPSAATGGTFTASNYNITYTPNSGILTVTTAALTITANNGSKNYGQTHTVGSGSTAFTSSGLQNGETIGSITIASTGAVATAAVGSYNIVPSTATGGTFTASNYSITYNNGTLTVNTASLTITANSGTKVYGTIESTPEPGSTVFDSIGLQNGETIGSVTMIYGSGALAATDPVGNTSTITPSAAIGGTFTASNYNITYVANSGTLTVIAAALTITANNGTKVYGTTQASPVSGSTAFGSTGLVNGETIGTVTLTYDSGALAATDPVGSTSTITPSAATGGTFTASNYDITYTSNSGTLTVTAAALTITADNAVKCFGTTYTLGTTAFTSIGLQNSETIGSVTLSSTGAASGAAVGSYAITPSAATGGTFTASNYSITYVDGSLTVNALPNAPTGTDGAICSPGTVNLSASVNGGEAVDWYDASSGGTLLLSNSTSYTTPSISSTTIYYAEARNTTTGCVSGSRTAVTAFVYGTSFNSGAISTSGETVCYNGFPAFAIGSLSDATGGDGSITYVWQANGVDIPDSNSPTYDPPPGLTVTTTYIRFAKDNTCNPTFTQSTGSWVVTISNDNTWTGSVSTAWSNGANWSCGVIPAAVSNVTISTATFYPEISSNVTINTLTLDSGTTLKVNSLNGLTVTDVIDNDGTLTIENNANLLQTNNVANTGSGTTVLKRNSSALKRLDYTLWSSPVTGQGLYAFSPLTFANRFYQYLTATNVYSNSLGFNIIGLNGNGVNGTDTNNVPFTVGQGYLIRMPWNHPTAPAVWNGQFTGVANNGDYSISINDNGAGFRYNLIGNPYPSPISAVDFVAANRQSGDERITGVLYFWRETNNTTANNAYCSWSPAGGGNGTFVTNSQPEASDLNGVIQTGQGFFVEAESGASAVEFDNSMRLNNLNGQFFRTTEEVNTVSESNRIWLNVTNATGLFCQTAFGYMTDATMGFDGGIDGRLINDGDIALYSTVGNESLVIQGRALPFDLSDVVPLGLRITNAGNYTIAIDHVDGLFSEGQTVYLRDNLTSTIHNLTTGAYDFNSDAGTFVSRFEVVYQMTLGVGTPVFNANQVTIYQNEVKDFVIKTGNIVMSEVKVFDVRGRLLLHKKGVNDSQTTINVGQTNEVLLVQITSQDGLVVTKKVIR